MFGIIKPAIRTPGGCMNSWLVLTITNMRLREKCEEGNCDWGLYKGGLLGLENIPVPNNRLSFLMLGLP